jgi:hypothetical protein
VLRKVLNVCLDASLVAIPNFADSAQIAEEIIFNAFDFSSAITSKLNINFVTSPKIDAVLYDNKCYPDFEIISEFLAEMQLLGVFSPNDVLSAYQTILDRSTRIEPLGGDVVDYVDFNCEPPLPDNLFPSALAAEIKRNLLVIGIAAETEFVAVALGLPAAAVPARLQIDGSVRLALPSSDSPNAVIDVLSTGIPVLHSPSKLLVDDWSGSLWADAASAYDFHLAISIRATLLCRERLASATADDLRKFSIGPEFVQSLVAHQAAKSGRFAEIVLNVCAQLVAGVCNRFKRHMGQPAKIVRSRDNAKAMRVHLTDSHEGLRLMYWENDQKIEFANIGPKFELMIVEGYEGGDRSGAIFDI